MLTTMRLYQINSSRILQHIRKNRGKSRIAVSEELGLDRSTLTKVVRDLIARNLVRTTGKYRGKPGVGRMATGLEINPDFTLVLGIEAQPRFCRWALVNLDGTSVSSGTHEYTAGNDDLCAHVQEIYQEALQNAQEKELTISGLGIGLSGIVDPYNGVILNSNPLSITSPWPIRTILEAKLGIPVFVENDANCCCWGELAFRSNGPSRNFLAFLGEFRNVDIGKNKINGTAFGIGLVIRGNVFHGDTFTAGEFRSLLYDHTKPGNSQFSISDQEAMRLPGDTGVLERVFDEVAYNGSLLVNCLDMNKVVIAGDFAAYPELLQKKLEQAIQSNWIYTTKKECAIEFSPDGPLAVAMGAAGLFIEKLFSVPDMTDHIDEAVGYILLERISPLPT